MLGFFLVFFLGGWGGTLSLSVKSGLRPVLSVLAFSEIRLCLRVLALVHGACLT